MKRINIGFISASLLLLIFLIAGVSNAKAEDHNENKVYYVLLKGTITNRVADDLKDVLTEAEKLDAKAIILEINTFGGRLDAAVRIKDNLVNTKINTIAFINKKAISAGALISLATKHIVMAPGSTIGAATPIKLTLWEEKPASEKVISYFRKEMKTTAEANNHPGEIAEAMVDPDVFIKGLVEKGKLLTLTTKEAVSLKIAERESINLEEVLKHFQLHEKDLKKSPISWTEKVVELMPDKKLIINPILIWFLIGLILAFLEFMVPGVILVFFGIAAWIVAILIYLGLANTVELQLIVFAISSIVLLIALRKWIKGKLYGHVSDRQDLDSNFDDLTGKSVLVLEDVIPGKMDGAVEFKGARWKAVSDVHIKKGDYAIIKGIDGITLKITKNTEA